MLTLEGGQSLATESLEYSLACTRQGFRNFFHPFDNAHPVKQRLNQRCLCCSEDGVCPCSCDYSQDTSCSCRDLEGVLSVQVTKSAVSLLYPLIYARTVNYAPIEKAVYKQNCRDGALDDNPTCGWYMLDGQRVADSQVPLTRVVLYTDLT